MTQTILPDQILKFKGKDFLEVIENMTKNHDELVEQNRKLQEIFNINEKKIICYETCIEFANSFINKGLVNNVPESQLTTTEDKDHQEIIMPDTVE